MRGWFDLDSLRDLQCLFLYRNRDHPDRRLAGIARKSPLRVQDGALLEQDIPMAP